VPAPRTPAIALAVALACAAAPAEAQLGRLGSLRAASNTTVAVRSETVHLDCESTDEENALRCALHVTWELANDQAEVATADVVFNWPFEEAVTMTIGGGDVGTAPTLRPLTVIVPPNGTTNVEIRADIRLGSSYLGTGSSIPSPITERDPLAARHPLLAVPWEIAPRGIVWSRPDDLRIHSIGPTHVRVRLPDGWHGAGDLHETREDDARVWAYDTPEGVENPARLVGIQFSRGSRGEPVRHGGPFIGLGGTFDQGFRGRLGYEIGFGEIFLASVSVDTDFERQVIITPQVEVASWSMLVVPSLSFAVGVPIQVVRHPTLAERSDVGIRLEASATLYAIAFVATLDIWPNDGVQISLLGRIGL
jgi:hypothetical protein